MIKLNLLPPREKEEAKLADFIHWLVFFTTPILVFLIIFILLLGGAFFSLFVMTKAQEEAIEIRESGSKMQELFQTEKKIAEINQILDQVHRKQKETISWTLILEEMSEITPKGIYLTNFSYDKNSNTIHLIGWAEERKDVLFMEKLLEESPLFEQVNSPLSNLLKQEEINFSFNFKPVI